jgi:hypothetical protein
MMSNALILTFTLVAGLTYGAGQVIVGQIRRWYEQ